MKLTPEDLEEIRKEFASLTREQFFQLVKLDEAGAAPRDFESKEKMIEFLRKKIKGENP